MTNKKEIKFDEYLKEKGRNHTQNGSALLLFDALEFPLEPLPDSPKRNSDCLQYLHGTSLIIATEALKQGYIVQITDRCAPWNNGYSGDSDFTLDLIKPEDLEKWI